jgi:UDP-glucose 4-epimerase
MLKGRVAVTGVSGMVGAHLLPVLAHRSVGVAGTSRRPPKTLPAGALWARWDLADWKTAGELDGYFPQVTALIHLGAQIPQSVVGDASPELIDVNVRATLALAAWAIERDIPVVYLSSATVYADTFRAGIAENDPRGGNDAGGLYGLTKLLAEELLLHFAHKGLRLSILRPSSLYGAGLPRGKMITSFLERAAAGQTIEIAPPADDRIDLIHAHDVAEAIVAVLDKGACGIFNVAGENPVTIAQVAQACVAAVGRGAVRIGPGSGGRPAQMRFGLCCEAARAAFGFAPQLTLVEGIRTMWQDLQSGPRQVNRT